MKRANLKILVLLSAAAMAMATLHAANRFVEAGLPAPDREWTGADYEAVAGLLKATTELPTLHDPDGAEMLRRMVDPQNFGLLQNRNLPINGRFPQLIPLMGGVRDILSAYITAANDRGADVHEELTLLIVFSLRASLVGLRLADEFLLSLPEDQRTTTRLDGLQKLRASVVTGITGVEESLSERGFYSATDRSRFLEAIREAIPEAVVVFSENYRVELAQKLKRRLPEFPAEPDQTALKAIITTIENYKPSRAPMPAVSDNLDI